MYTHKVICSSTVRKLVKFCQTWFFFLNVMPGASFTFTPGFPAGFLTACSADAGLALEGLLVYMVSPGQVGGPSGLTFRTSIVFLGRLGYGVLGSPAGTPAGQCGHGWAVRRGGGSGTPFPCLVWSQGPGGAWGQEAVHTGAWSYCHR